MESTKKERGSLSTTVAFQTYTTLSSPLWEVLVVLCWIVGFRIEEKRKGTLLIRIGVGLLAKRWTLSS